MQTNSQPASGNNRLASASSHNGVDLDLTAQGSDEGAVETSLSENSSFAGPSTVELLDPRTIEQREPNRLSEAFESTSFQDLVDSILNARGNTVPIIVQALSQEELAAGSIVRYLELIDPRAIGRGVCGLCGCSRCHVNFPQARAQQ